MRGDACARAKGRERDYGCRPNRPPPCPPSARTVEWQFSQVQSADSVEAVVVEAMVAEFVGELVSLVFESA